MDAETLIKAIKDKVKIIISILWGFMCIVSTIEFSSSSGINLISFIFLNMRPFSSLILESGIFALIATILFYVFGFNEYFKTSWSFGYLKMLVYSIRISLLASFVALVLIQIKSFRNLIGIDSKQLFYMVVGLIVGNLLAGLISTVIEECSHKDDKMDN